MMCSHQLYRHSLIKNHITSAIPVCRYHAVLSTLTKTCSSPCPKWSRSRTRRDAGGWTASGLTNCKAAMLHRARLPASCSPGAKNSTGWPEPPSLQQDEGLAPNTSFSVPTGYLWCHQRLELEVSPGPPKQSSCHSPEL